VNHGDAVVVIWRAKQGLAAASIDALKPEVVRIARQWLIAIETTPRHASTANPTQAALIAADHDVGRTIDYHFERTLTPASAPGDTRLDHLITLGWVLNLGKRNELRQAEENQDSKDVHRANSC
jgi:hypothetical protein